jgi:hypothetical protein
VIGAGEIISDGFRRVRSQEDRTGMFHLPHKR